MTIMLAILIWLLVSLVVGVLVGRYLRRRNEEDARGDT